MEGRVVNRVLNDDFVDGDAPRARVVQYCMGILVLTNESYHRRGAHLSP